MLGNPLNWRNAAALAWDGRQLQNLTSFYEDVVGYTYNADGIRVFKKYFDRQNIIIYNHSYVVDGANIVSETITNSRTGKTYTLYYFYDEKGEVAGFEYNGDAYFYQKNIQGDVLRVCNEGGDIVAEYNYDTWGKVLSVTDAKGNAIMDETHVANLNPFRYRSYYYDVETGFYYLNSRYYDPEVGRFLNADSIVGANGGIDGYNLFAYCNNNPVMRTDPSGYGEVITAPKQAPAEIMEEIRKADLRATTDIYSHSYQQGDYYVHVFNSSIRTERKRFFIFFERTVMVWSVAKYYFVKLDTQGEYQHYKRLYDFGVDLSNIMSYSDASSSYGHYSIDIIMAGVTILKPYVDKMVDSWGKKADYFKNHSVTYELLYVEVYNYENGSLKSTKVLYP